MSGSYWTPAERIAKHSRPLPNGCIEWTGAINAHGYGQSSYYVDGKQRNCNAHRFSYLVTHGEIPEGMHVHHVCYNRRCINPAHLELRTPKGNVHDAGSRNVTKAFAEATHCVHGHPFSGDNLYVRPTGERLCRECSRRNARETSRRKTRRECPKGMATCMAAHCVYCGRMCHSHPGESPACAPGRCHVRDRSSLASSGVSQ